MNSMESNFVPYQIALDMKSIEFDEPCLGKFYYNQLEIGGNWCNNDFKEDPDVFISAPLYQQAFRWFREKYGLESDIIFHTDYLENSDKNVYEVNIQNRISDELHLITPLNGFKTYEEAELSCLKKLIEIVKQK